jgi:hypothetical protein
MSAPPLPLPPPPSPPRERGRARLVTWIILAASASIVILLNLGKSAYSDYRSASAAVDRFHLRLNAGDYDAIYADASEPFRRSGNHAQWIGYFEKAHQKMGNSGKASTISFYIHRKDGRAWVEEVVNTQFSLEQAHESFVWIGEGDQLQLYWYQIESPNLH